MLTSVLTFSDSTIPCADRQSPLQSHLRLGLPWNWSSSLVSCAPFFGICFGMVEEIAVYLTSRLEKQSSCPFHFSFSETLHGPQWDPVNCFSPFLPLFALLGRRWLFLPGHPFQFWSHGAHSLPSKSVPWCHSKSVKGCTIHDFHLPACSDGMLSATATSQSSASKNGECGSESLSKMRMEIYYLAVWFLLNVPLVTPPYHRDK